MRVFLSFLVIFVALHSCSAFYESILSEAMKFCPEQNDKIMNLALECKEKIFDSIEIMAHDTEDQLYQGYVMWVLNICWIMNLILFFQQTLKDLPKSKTNQNAKRMYRKNGFSIGSMFKQI